MGYPTCNWITTMVTLISCLFGWTLNYSQVIAWTNPSFFFKLGHSIRGGLDVQTQDILYPQYSPKFEKPKVLTVWIELWHALNIWCSQCLTVKATRISHQGWLALTRPTIGFCCGNWSLALETFWQWLPLMYDPGMILQILNCSLKCQIPWVTAHGIWGLAPLGLKPPGNHAGPRICPLSGQDVLWTRTCGWSLLSTWAVFPQTVKQCAHNEGFLQ